MARTVGLAGELGRVAAGRSGLAPAKGDRRFGDPAWGGNWLLRRVLQSYLAVGDAVDGLITDADIDWRAERRARLAAGNVIDALAPGIPKLCGSTSGLSPGPSRSIAAGNRDRFQAKVGRAGPGGSTKCASAKCQFG